MSSRNHKKNKKKNTTPAKKAPVEIVYTPEEVFSMMEDTSQILAQENATRLSSMGPAASESSVLTDSVEFWNWMNRNYAKSGHFASAESMQSYISGTPGQQAWAKKIVQGKGYEWDWMSSQRSSFKNLFKSYSAGDVANRPGSDITAHDILSGADKEFQLKAYTSKNTPHLKNTPKDMAVVTNAEKVDSVAELGYRKVVPFGDNSTIETARDKRLADMTSGKATPTYSVRNVGATMAKAGVVEFVLSAGVETIVSYRSWKEGKISAWEYLKEIMKSGGNASTTSTFAAGIMIPVTAAITTAGVSSLVTIPISFVVTAAVDKVVAPAFGRGDYKKIIQEATYYQSMTGFCGSLAYTMELASNQYEGFVSQMGSQQRQFTALAGNVISQQALDDFEYYASLPEEEVGVVISGMTTLLTDTDTKFDSLKDQNWFQRMSKTVTGKNKATKEDIKKNYERLGVYVSKAVQILYERQCVSETVLRIHGEEIVALCQFNIALNSKIEVLTSRFDNLTDALLLVTRPDTEARTVSVKQLVDENAQKKYDEAEKLFIRGKLIDAFPLFKEAADNGVGRACYYVGEYYANGYGHLVEDESAALEYWHKGMSIGDPLSTYEYGFFKYATDEYQCFNWMRKHIHPVLRLAKEDDNAALCVYGCHTINDNEGTDLRAFFDSMVDSIAYFQKAAKNGYWPGAIMFYQLTEEVRKSGTVMPDYSDLLSNVEWYRVQQITGMFELLYGTDDYERTAWHLHQALWLRDDKFESAGSLAFLLNAGLIKDSIANGYSKGNMPMYYNAGLDAKDENFLFYVGMMYFYGIGLGKDDNEAGKDTKKAYEYLLRSYNIFEEKTKKKEPVFTALYGFAAGLLGFMCLYAEGTDEDLDTAFKYLTIGHNLDDPMAIFTLAACYKEGFGVKKDALMVENLKAELREASSLLGVEEFFSELQ